MGYRLACVGLFIFLECYSCLAYETITPATAEEAEENQVCNREGGRIWLCKNATECFSTQPIFKGSLKNCSEKYSSNQMMCCPADIVVESISQTKCSQYQRLLCENEYVGPRPVLYKNVGDFTRNIETTTETLPKHYINGGRRAYAKSHPYMALIGYGEATRISWQCGGSLISERFVLSAAHCSNTSYGLARWVRLGDLDLDSVTEDARPRQFQIEKRIVHSRYSAPAYYNDIVLFKLDKEVVFDEYVGPACLHNSIINLQGRGIATGWGRTTFDGPRSSYLQEVSLKFIPAEECKLAVGVIGNFLNQGIDEQTMICAGEPGKDTCQGDSGGPLTLESRDNGCLATQVGVTSFGPRFCGMTDVPGTYVRVAYYLPWIESVVWPRSTKD